MAFVLVAKSNENGKRLVHIHLQDHDRRHFYPFQIYANLCPHEATVEIIRNKTQTFSGRLERVIRVIISFQSYFQTKAPCF